MVFRRKKLNKKLEFNKKEIEIGKKLFLGSSMYLTSSTNIKNLPKHDLNEIAFAGRSNVGKSSLINSLTNRKKLARFSKTPGRTRQLNFFKIENKLNRLILVDLPGYGYAKVAKKDISEWIEFTNHYFFQRVNLRTVCLLLDIRRELYSHDLIMMDYLDSIGLSWTIILTKVDKVEKNIVSKKKLELSEKLDNRPAAYPYIFTTSSNKNIGIEELRAYISSFVGK